MLESIKIAGFRKYKELELGNFDRINFILGDNNIGKTTILEAIYAWACGENIIPFLNIPLARGRYGMVQIPYWVMEALLAMVNDRRKLPLRITLDAVSDGERVSFEHTIHPSELLTEYDSTYKNLNRKAAPRTNGRELADLVATGVESGVSSAFTPPVIANWEVKRGDKSVNYVLTMPMLQGIGVKPFRLAKYVDLLSHTAIAECVQVYASLKRERILDEVTAEMNKVFPEIAGFDMIPYPDGSQAPVSILKADGTMLPLYAYGDGVQRWFYILGIIALHKNSIICIDEIDTGFHPTAQVEFCTKLVIYAEKHNVQIFLTTHNIEFVDSFLQSMDSVGKESADAVRVITLRNHTQDFSVRNISASEAADARKEFRLELSQWLRIMMMRVLKKRESKPCKHYCRKAYSWRITRTVFF